MEKRELLKECFTQGASVHCQPGGRDRREAHERQGLTRKDEGEKETELVEIKCFRSLNIAS